MKAHGHPRMRPWKLLGVIGLVAHSAVLYYVLSRTALSVAVVSGVIVLIVINHLGWLSSLYARVRCRSRQLKPGDHVACGRDPEHLDDET
jgi:hypothetical protein